MNMTEEQLDLYQRGALPTRSKRGVAKAAKALSPGEETLALHLKAEGIRFEREYQFHPGRKWRFDFLIGNKTGIEVEGGIYGGRHTRPEGFTADTEKYNQAALDGYTVLRYTTAQVKSGAAIKQITALIKGPRAYREMEFFRP